LIWVIVRIKIVIIIILKPDYEVESRQGPCHILYWLLTRANVKIKLVIIIVLNLNWGSTRGKARVDHWPSQHKNKSDYYHGFKSNSGVDPKQGPGGGSSWPLTCVNIKIKVVIIIVLKSDTGVDPMPRPGHGSGWPLNRINVRIKLVIIIILKLTKELTRVKA
jgi:hypothetical protein